ncbi:MULTISPECIES: hypothetical protein [unclassified Streptomyces]|uniref:hypothetical protein n=1 Tax=unclassified Streptomyces TaxID=2593676 RepID=UPI0033B4D8FC
MIAATGDAAPDAWRRLAGRMLRAYATPGIHVPPPPQALAPSALHSSRILGEADRPGVATQAVVRDPPDFPDLATVMGILAGEPVEALLVGEIFHGQRCSDDEVFVNNWAGRGIVRAGRAKMRFG